MASIDKRIVEMKFDNAAFERGVATTLSTLDKLKQKLNLGGAAKGLEDLSKAGKKVDLSHMGAGVDAVTAKFSALQVAGLAALGTIVARATSAGADLVKSLSIAPVMDGFREYELKMGSIQTIMANTARHGTTLETVNRELDALNKYADKTIYNFAEMTKNASLFTNSGMKIEDATTVIKGFSNSAAASGTSAAGAAGAAYQLSQALSAGMIRLMDWRSLTNVGMGGKNMQDGIITIAKAMGTLKEGSDTAKLAVSDFNSSLEKKWLTADVMSTYLKAMSGDMDNAALSALGLNDAQIKTIQSQAKMGLEAATKVRTLTQLMSTLKEAVASGWTESFEIIFGNFTEATNLFTSISQTVGGFFDSISNARNKMLQDWKNDNGRHFFLVGLKNAFTALFDVMKVVRQAFRELFPAMTGKQLADLSERFMHFTEGLRAGSDTLQRIKSTFEGVFSILKIGMMILSGFVKAVFAVFSTASEGSGAILSVTSIIGEFLHTIQRMLAYTGLIDKFFKVLVSPLLLIKPVIGLISDLAEALSKLAMGDISGFGRGIKEAFGNLGNALGDIRDKFNGFTNSLSSGLGVVTEMLTGFATNAIGTGNAFVGKLAAMLAAVTGFLSRFAADARGAVTELIGSLKQAASDGQNFFAGLSGSGLEKLVALVDMLRSKFDSLKTSMDFSATFASFNTGAATVSGGSLTALSGLGGAVASIWTAIKSVFSGISSGLGPILSAISDFFTTVISKIREYIADMDMQDLVALINTGFLLLLFNTIRSYIGKAKELVEALSNVFGGVTETLEVMQKNIKANIIMKIAIAVGILVGAVVLLSQIDAKALGVALAALSGVFIQLGLMLAVITKIDPKSFNSSAAGMILMATAIRILASAVKALGEMDFKVLIQGGIALNFLIASLSGMVMILNGMKGIFTAAAGLLILSAAMTAMTVPILIFSKIPFDVLADGIISMGLALIGLGIGMSAMPKGMVLKAAGLVILSQALVVFAGVISVLGLLPADAVKQGLISIAAGLGILAIAANAMSGALKGAAAMMIMAGALAVLTPVIVTLGMLDLSTIGKGLLAIVGVFAAIGLAAVVLGPIVPVIAALAASLMLLGGAMLVAGAGFALFTGGLAVLATVGTAGFAVLIAGAEALLNLLPLMAQQAGYAVIAFAKVIGDAAPKLVGAFVKVIESILQAIIKLIPQIIGTVGLLMYAFVLEITKRIPQFAAAGLDMIIGLLLAIRQKLPLIVMLGIDIITTFIKTLGLGLPKIIQSGVDFILSFIEGLADAIRGNKERTGEAGADLAKAIVEGMIAGLQAMGRMVPGAIRDLVMGMISGFKNLLGIHSPSQVFDGFGKDIVMGLIQGIGKMVGKAASKAVELAGKLISSALGALGKAGSVGVDFVTKIISGVGSMIGSLGGKAKELVTTAISNAKNNIGAAFDVGKDIVQGIANGITKGLSIVTDAAKKIGEKALSAAKSVLGIFSPSKEFAKLGEFVNEGFAEGMVGSQATVTQTFEQMTDLLKQATDSAANVAERAAEKQQKLTDSIKDQNDAIKAQTDRVKVARKALEEQTKASDSNAKSIQNAKTKVQEAEAKLRTMTEARDADTKALVLAKKELADAERERNLAAAGTDLVANKLQNEQAELKKLSGEYDTLTDKLKEAKDVLDAAVKTRDDFEKSITEKYGVLPDVDRDVSVAKYISNLEKKLKETNEFSVAIQKLRDLGLSDAMYKELLAKGVDVFPFVKELLAGGQAAVQRINELGTGLDKAASELGFTASRSLYQAGVDAAQGIVSGLQSQMGAIEAAMNEIAALIENKLKMALELETGTTKPPSLPGPWKRNGQLPVSSKVSDSMQVPITYHPVITPVVDLSNVQKASSQISQSLSTSPAYRTATGAASSLLRSRQLQQQYTPSTQSSITFNQYNTSPKALSTAEIYRQTNNQISVAKGALTNA